MMKRAIASWGCGKGRIITVTFSAGALTSKGVGHLLSLPHNTLSNLSELILSCCELDSECCEVLSHCLSSLSHLEMLYLADNEIGCEGAQLLSQSLHADTALKVLSVSGNNHWR